MNELISIVMPCYNESEGVSRLVGILRETLSRVDARFEVILVDDGSRDETWQAIEREAADWPAVRGLRLSRNFGKERALCAGLDASHGDAVVTIDADLQHPPSLIPEMIRRWRETDAKVVQAVKAQRGKESPVTRVGSYVFYRLMMYLAGLDLRGATDFKLLDRSVVEAWKQLPERSPFYRGMVAWLGFPSVQIPFDVEDRACGRTRWSLWGLCRLAVHAIGAFSLGMLRVSVLIGAVFGVFALVLAAQSIYRKLTGSAAEGFTTVIILQLIVGAFILFAIGVNGDYIARIYRQTRQWPRYLISDRIGDPPPGAKPDDR
jgi:glycosyltransferase involved in cell wall biosynthesis